MALAIESLCFWPPDRRTPFSPITVLYFSGSSSMNSLEAANSQAFFISFSVASNFAYLILFSTLSSNKTISWLTKEILFLREYSEISFMLCPSINILPLCC